MGWGRCGGEGALREDVWWRCGIVRGGSRYVWYYGRETSLVRGGVWQVVWSYQWVVCGMMVAKSRVWYDGGRKSCPV